MAHYLVYWKIFWDDDVEDRVQHNKNLVVRNGYGASKFSKDVGKGDVLWVVGRRRESDIWLLLQKLFVKKLTPSADGDRRAKIDSQKSWFFTPDKQLNCESILRTLAFASGRKIRKTGREIGQCIENPRRLSSKDEEILSHYARKLPRLETTTTQKIAEFIELNVGGEREMILALIELRRGQPEFRRKLLAVYGGKCAISRNTAEKALEAAHIIPYKDQPSNHASNGLLLRADLHTLFDLGLLAVETKGMTILVAKELKSTDYASYAGKTLHIPSNVADQPSTKALKSHRRKSGL